MKIILSAFLLGLGVWPSLVYSQNTIEVGLRFTPQATAIRYRHGVGNKYDFLKTAIPNEFAPHYSRIRTAQGVGIIYNPFLKLRLGADLLYSLQGGGYEQRKTNLNYLKIPIWFGYNSSPKKKLIFTVQTGIELSYLVRAKVKYENETIDIRKYVNNTTWGVPFAIGIKFKAYTTYYVTTQLYLYSDFHTLSKTNSEFGAYNYVYPGIRISIDQNILNFNQRN